MCQATSPHKKCVKWSFADCFVVYLIPKSRQDDGWSVKLSALSRENTYSYASGWYSVSRPVLVCTIWYQWCNITRCIWVCIWASDGEAGCLETLCDQMSFYDLLLHVRLIVWDASPPVCDLYNWWLIGYSICGADIRQWTILPDKENIHVYNRTLYEC